MEGSKVPRKVRTCNTILSEIIVGRRANNYIMNQSCDFCYLRKIKCDGQKPRCSHCVTYMMDCTYVAPSRQSKSKKRRGSAKIEESKTNLQTRLQRLEALIEQLTEHSSGADKQDETQAQLHEPRPIPPVTLPTIMANEGRNTDDNGSSPKDMDLPPLQQVLPLVHIFLEKFNAVLSLFHAGSLLRLIHDYYNLDPQNRDPVAWAAINVVLAITYRQGLMGDRNIKHSVEYLSRAQSVLSEVVLHDIQLLNIQVLVGIIMLLHGSEDHQPSLILIAMTMRLAHKIGLHSRASSAHLDAVLARQRARVFWIAYILDKDLSVRLKQPSVQLDEDIDLDLPYPQIDEYRVDNEAEMNDASIGVIATADGTVKMSYFVTRIQLAVIEGGVYDYLYSTRASKRSPEERSGALESVARALEHWKASIPPEFNGAEVSKRVPPDMLWFFCELDATNLLCRTSINQAHAWNAHWVTSLRRYGREGAIPLLPPHWEALVDEARDLMVLVGQLGVIDRWSFW